MDLQPTLIGEFLSLRPLVLDDFEALYSVASDPLIWEQHPCTNRHERNIFQALFLDRLKSNGALVITDNKNQTIIGSSGFYDLNKRESKVVVGYTFLARSYWGGEYNRAIKNLMLNYAFKFVKTVEFHIAEANIRSQRAIEKIGAIQVGQFEKEDSNKTKKIVLTYQLRSDEFIS